MIGCAADLWTCSAQTPGINHFSGPLLAQWNAMGGFCTQGSCTCTLGSMKAVDMDNTTGGLIFHISTAIGSEPGNRNVVYYGKPSTWRYTIARVFDHSEQTLLVLGPYGKRLSMGTYLMGFLSRYCQQSIFLSHLADFLSAFGSLAFFSRSYGCLLFSSTRGIMKGGFLA